MTLLSFRFDDMSFLFLFFLFPFFNLAVSLLSFFSWPLEVETEGNTHYYSEGNLRGGGRGRGAGGGGGRKEEKEKVKWEGRYKN